MKFDFKRPWLNLIKLTEMHKPEVLAGFGISLMAAAVPLAVMATVKTCKKVEEKKKEIANDISSQIEYTVNPKTIEVPAKEVVKLGWKYYIAPFVSLAAGTVCSIASTKEGLKRTAAMAAAYQFSEAALNEYRSATKEVVGEKKENEINQKIIRDRMEMITDEDGHVVNVYDTRDGTTLCFDYWSGRYFYSDIDYIRSQINMVNEVTLQESKVFDGYATLNDVYAAIGLPQSGAGESLTWRIDKEGLIKLRPTSMLVDGDRPCWVLNFETPPHYMPSWSRDRI